MRKLFMLLTALSVGALWMSPMRTPAAMQTPPTSPMPTATTTQDICPANREAIVKNALPPDYPNAARDLRLGPVMVVVDVSVSASGDVTGLRLAQSSNNAAIDVAAMEAALKSAYTPKIVSCKGVAGHYLFRAEFNPD